MFCTRSFLFNDRSFQELTHSLLLGVTGINVRVFHWKNAWLLPFIKVGGSSDRAVSHSGFEWWPWRLCRVSLGSVLRLSTNRCWETICNAILLTARWYYNKTYKHIYAHQNTEQELQWLSDKENRLKASPAVSTRDRQKHYHNSVMNYPCGTYFTGWHFPLQLHRLNQWPSFIPHSRTI